MLTAADLNLNIRASAAEFNKVTDQVAQKSKITLQQIQNGNKKTDASFKSMSKGASGSLGNLSSSLSSMGPAGGAAAGGVQKLALAAKALNVALGPIGIILLAVGVAIKALQQYFKGSTDGANALAKIMGTFRGIMQGLQDILIAVGRFLYEVFSKPKESALAFLEILKKIGTAIVENIKNRFEGLVELFVAGWRTISAGARGVGLAIASIFNKEKRGEAAKAFEEMKEGLLDVGRAAVKIETGFTPEELVAGFDKLKEAGSNAWGKIGEFAEKYKTTIENSQKIADRENALWEKKNKFITEGANLERKIAELRVEAGDRLKSDEERQKTLNELNRVQTEYYKKKVDIANDEYTIQRDINALGESGREDLDKEQTLLAGVDSLLAEQATKQRFIVNTQATITEGIKKSEAEMQKFLDTTSATADKLAEAALIKMQLSLEEDALANIQEMLDNEKPLVAPSPITDTTAFTKGWIGALDIVKGAMGQHQQDWQELGTWVQDIIAGTLVDAVLALGDAFGSLFSDQKQGFKEVVSVILKGAQQIIVGLLATAIAAAIEGGVSEGGPILGLALAAIGIAGVLALWSRVPKFGDGGYVDKPTLALIGEKGPEFVVPANKSMGGRTLTLKQTAPLTFRLEGGDLYAGVQLQEILQNIG